ncbi:zinc-binding dehydrogenase [Agrococcus casei]|uniref:L-idonate 5-dehydrogenase n=1 Tax=Agrococcus casei LMG 22410 TaxID=1255656 RepID=A0A1R4FTP7_9MICO|nr:zinc-binding dehydrogenase [Agrococcus casei]SJM59213.1 L-idonate 5-dehydrogenase [Agrococcus casei LMG 22410]
MRAAFITAKQTVEVRDVPTPEPREDEVRIRVDYVGVCGSDLHYYFEGANGAFVVQEPLVPGHELSGRIDFDPKGEWAPGTGVTVHPARFGDSQPGIEDDPHLWPNGSYLGSASTWPHTQGALAEQLVVDRSMIRVLPESLTVRTAVLAEPLAVAMHGVAKAGDAIKGARVLVTGSGPIGLLAIAAALDAGAASVTATDVLEGPLQRALGMGAEAAINVATDEVPEGAFDVVLECSGVAPSISTAFHAARKAATVVQIGMVPNEPRPVNLAPFISKELRVYGTFRFKDEIDAAISLLAKRPEIELVITHEFDAGNTAELFAVARDSEASGKVIATVWPE